MSLKYIRYKHLVFGILTFFPGLSDILFKKRKMCATNSARYYYSVYLRHLVIAHNKKLPTAPKIVAEIGPGSKLGIGFAALISGAESYYAFDVVKHVDDTENIEIFDELVNLFRIREDIPGDEEFPEVKPKLDSYLFPERIFSNDHLIKSLNEERLNDIRQSVINMNVSDSKIKYIVPWNDPSFIDEGSVDLIISQAVLEHVDDLKDTYKSIHTWLNKGGVMSSQIDFKCHGTSSVWNGHWTFSDIVWGLLRGKQVYLLNREPYSYHIKLLKDLGFTLYESQVSTSPSILAKEELATKFKSLNDKDLSTSGALIQCVK